MTHAHSSSNSFTVKKQDKFLVICQCFLLDEITKWRIKNVKGFLKFIVKGLRLLKWFMFTMSPHSRTQVQQERRKKLLFARLFQKMLGELVKWHLWLLFEFYCYFRARLLFTVYKVCLLTIKLARSILVERILNCLLTVCSFNLRTNWFLSGSPQARPQHKLEVYSHFAFKSKS